MQSETSVEDSPATTPLKGLLVLVGVVLVVACFIALCQLLGVSEFWSGFLFVMYWGMVEKVDPKRLPHVVLGGLAGMLVGYSSVLLGEHLGGIGGYLFIPIILTVIYCQIMGWLPAVVNMMTMIFLTVCTIPAILENTSLLGSLQGFFLGVVFFGGFISTGMYVKQRQSV